MEKAVRGVETASQLYGAGKAIFEMGKGLYTIGRIAAPLLL